MEHLAQELFTVKAELDEFEATSPVVHAAKNTDAKRENFTTIEFPGELM